jgi:PAS domain S-box-containing protein
VEGKPTSGDSILDRAPALETEVALDGRGAWETHGRQRARRDSIFDHAPVAIQELDAEGRLLQANLAFCRLTGYPAEELVGRPIAEIVDGAAGAAAAFEQLALLLQRGTGVVRFDLDFVCRDGSLLHGRVTAGVLPADRDGVASVLALVEDATGQLPGDEAAAPSGTRTDAVEAVAGAVARARELGVDVAFAYATEPLWVQADQAELRGAVDRLLATAVRAAPRGSLAVRCTASGTDALLEVLPLSDTDLAGADLGAVFGEPGGEVAPLSARRLAPVRAVVEASNGTVGVSSAPGRGPGFTVSLPLAGV